MSRDPIGSNNTRIWFSITETLRTYSLISKILVSLVVYEISDNHSLKTTDKICNLCMTV